MTTYHRLPSQALEMARAQAAQLRHLVKCLKFGAIIDPPKDVERFEKRIADLEAMAGEFEARAKELSVRECA